MTLTTQWVEREKIIGVPLSKSKTKAKDGTLTINGYFTSDNKDEVGDIITRGATERAIEKYRQWGNIRYMHLPRPVAKVVGIGEADGLEWNEVKIKVIDPQAVFEVENDLLSALSVGIMIKFDDVDFLDDGGLVINDYSLAEISLVDHPANYDAKFKDLTVDQGLHMYARQYGLDAVAVSMKKLLDRELTMDKKDKTEELDAIETEPIVEEKDLSAEEAAVEETEEEIEKEITVSIEDPVDEVAEEAAEVEAEKVIEADEAVEDEPVEEEVEKDITADSEEDVIKGFMETVLSELRDLNLRFANFLEAQETPAEDSLAVDQTESGEVEEKEAAVVAGTDEVELDTTPAERKSAVQETELPAAEDVTEEEKSTEAVSLNEALTKYFERR